MSIYTQNVKGAILTSLLLLGSVELVSCAAAKENTSVAVSTAKSVYPTQEAGVVTVSQVTIATDPSTIVVPKTVPVSGPAPTGTTLNATDLSQQDTDFQALMEKNHAFVQHMIDQGIDLQSLPRQELAAEIGPMPQTLNEAQGSAVYVVLGVIARLDITPVDVQAEIIVKNVLKGKTEIGSVLKVQTGEVVTPNANYTGGILGLMPTYPGLITGDEAMFFITIIHAKLYAFTGADTLIISGGVVKSNSANPYNSSVQGLIVSALEKRIGL